MPSPLAIAAGVVGGLALLAAVLTLALATAFRLRLTPVMAAIRRLNRRVLNPRQLARGAGQPDSAASVIHHVGRTSGRSYCTPVVAVPSGDCFVIVLPYGPGTDWVRNVLAADEATLAHDGQEIPVEHPAIVPLRDVDHLFEARDQRSHRWFGLREALVLRCASPPGPDAPVVVQATALRA